MNPASKKSGKGKKKQQQSSDAHDTNSKTQEIVSHDELANTGESLESSIVDVSKMDVVKSDSDAQPAIATLTGSWTAVDPQGQETVMFKDNKSEPETEVEAVEATQATVVSTTAPVLVAGPETSVEIKQTASSGGCPVNPIFVAKKAVCMACSYYEQYSPLVKSMALEAYNHPVVFAETQLRKIVDYGKQLPLAGGLVAKAEEYTLCAYHTAESAVANAKSITNCTVERARTTVDQFVFSRLSKVHDSAVQLSKTAYTYVPSTAKPVVDRAMDLTLSVSQTLSSYFFKVKSQ
eukprot:GILK01003134.1.p1 GENE.GILK01003134.1~~GILK01003134.1.p1  ORF type:complete len:292 (-),score=52.51 GILK01003134.1:46-921(-)